MSVNKIVLVKDDNIDTPEEIYENATHALTRGARPPHNWELIEKETGEVLDHCAFRHDLAERNNIKLEVTELKEKG